MVTTPTAGQRSSITHWRRMPSAMKSLRTAGTPGHVWRWARATLWTCLLLACWRCPTGVLGDISISSITSSPSSAIGTATSLAPSPTSFPPSSTSLPPSPSPSPSPSHFPTPPPTPFLEYVLKKELYLRIDEMYLFLYAKAREGYYNLTVDTALQSQPSLENATRSGNTLNFTKQYWYNKTGQSNSTFVFTFVLTLEPTTTDQMWYISSFSHRNRTDPPTANSTTTCSFHYSGMSVVHAPSDLSYSCSNLKFRGDCLNNISSEVHFVGLFIQAFKLKNKTPSSTYVDCGAKDHNNSIIDVVVGSVVGITIGIALLVIVGTLIFRAIGKKVRLRGYNLLDD